MKTVIVDNYDSFTYNLYHMVRELGADPVVVRNDKFALEDLGVFDKIILSPGPGIPGEAGLLEDVIRYYAGKKPILGICLGEQAIGEVFGASLVNLKEVFHGVRTPVRLLHDSDDYIFSGMPSSIDAGRYHSWVVSRDNFPSCLEVTAESDERLIMALRHKDFDIHGIQFHPESVLTPSGKTIIENWMKY
ncbi:MAG: aminodeoxychorismate/anthranilate synthase component II [Bacteroidales bacterium]|jgi:anthranilate synthase component 2|nr:aminodeoxychorismate/anthranilate synthase component II [Bacteroidales bacterium]MCI1785914.1 aminodeoxychorismate/anthranilate synthase component II [Bacteroidales bacterium]